MTMGATTSEPTHFDAVVVGAGLGGLYAIYRLRQQGLSVLALEKASGVGGVWFHNRYPGARVDVESAEYCYYFSPELYKEWQWTERYATQKELLAYLNHVADRFDIRRHIRFQEALTKARWDPAAAVYHLETSKGNRMTCRFLVMATGNLSEAKKPDFKGLDEFQGEWAMTSHWPEHPVQLEGRRIAVIGTGSSGVQTIATVAPLASHLYVFQRSPNYSVPAQNRPVDKERHAAIAADVPGRRAQLMNTRAAMTSGQPSLDKFADLTEAERQERLERQWNYGGQGMNRVFADQGTNQEANDYVAEFVRQKIRSIVKDPKVAEKLCPYDHPIGSRRLCIDINYYETYNRDNVTLVDISEHGIERITPKGIRTDDGQEYEVDLIIFALGFAAFRGALDTIDIRNPEGLHPTSRWNRGPRTMLGLMTHGFPNLFILTGPGCPSVLSNMVLMNEEHVNWVADLIAYMDANGMATVEPTWEAEEKWGEEVAAAARPLLRLHVKNYMVHVNHDDGSRVFIPYVGGFDRYMSICHDIAAKGYPGFVFTPGNEAALSQKSHG